MSCLFYYLVLKDTNKLSIHNKKSSRPSSGRELYADIVFISALTGQRMHKLFEHIETVIQNQNMRIGTGVLNEIMMEAVSLQQPPSDKGKRLKIYYMTQASIEPPTFVFFVNKKDLFHFSYQRYLENRLRDTFGFKGTPLRFIIRERGEK